MARASRPCDPSEIKPSSGLALLACPAVALAASCQCHPSGTLVRVARRLLTIARISLVYAVLGLLASVAVAWGLAWGTTYLGAEHRSHGAYLEERAQNVNIMIHDFVDFSSLGPYVHVNARYTWGSTRRSWFYREREMAIPPPAQLGLSDPTSQDQFNLRGPTWSGLVARNTWPGELGPPTSWGTVRNYEFLPSTEFPPGWMDEAVGLPFACLWHEWKLDDAGTVTYAGGIELPPRTSPTGLVTGHSLRGLPLRPIRSALATNTAFYAVVVWLCVRTFKGLRGWRRFSRGLCPACAYDLCFDYSRGCSECGRGTQRVLTTRPECQ